MTDFPDSGAPVPSAAARRKARWWILALCAVPLAGVVVVGVLATVVVPKILASAPQAQLSRARSDIATLDAAMRSWRERHGSWPDELPMLARSATSDPAEPLLETLPIDPWGRPYRYELPIEPFGTPRIFTLGADDRPGGRRAASDVDNARDAAARR